MIGGFTNNNMMNQTGNQFTKANNTTAFGFGNNTTIGGGGQALNPESFVLEGVSLEFELKSSDFATIVSRNLVEAAILQVSLDRENVMDLRISRDISENAQLEIQNISSDKRSLRDK